MTAKKFEKYVHKLTFRDGPGFYRQVATLDGNAMGLDACIQYGVYRAAGAMAAASPAAHQHDFNQVMLWMGADPADMGELGAEVELSLGEDGEKHMITTSTAVWVTAGTPHFPATITRMDKRFIFMTVSCAPEYSETTVPGEREKYEKAPIAAWFGKYRSNIINLAFTRKGAWSYGEKNRDDSGGHLAFIRSNDENFDFLIMTESIKKAPYRFGPEPDKPHVHPKPEILFFMGTDLNDISQLHGEAEIYLGKVNEMERYVITEPTAVVIPGGLAHCPLVFTRIDRPIILTDVRPFGSERPQVGKL